MPGGVVTAVALAPLRGPPNRRVSERTKTTNSDHLTMYAAASPLLGGPVTD